MGRSFLPELWRLYHRYLIHTCRWIQCGLPFPELCLFWGRVRIPYVNWWRILRHGLDRCRMVRSKWRWICHAKPGNHWCIHHRWTVWGHGRTDFDLWRRWYGDHDGHALIARCIHQCGSDKVWPRWCWNDGGRPQCWGSHRSSRIWIGVPERGHFPDSRCVHWGPLDDGRQRHHGRGCTMAYCDSLWTDSEWPGNPRVWRLTWTGADHQHRTRCRWWGRIAYPRGSHTQGRTRPCIHRPLSIHWTRVWNCASWRSHGLGQYWNTTRSHLRGSEYLVWRKLERDGSNWKQCQNGIEIWFEWIRTYKPVFTKCSTHWWGRKYCTTGTRLGQRMGLGRQFQGNLWPHFRPLQIDRWFRIHGHWS